MNQKGIALIPLIFWIIGITYSGVAIYKIGHEITQSIENDTFSWIPTSSPSETYVKKLDALVDSDPVTTCNNPNCGPIQIPKSQCSDSVGYVCCNINNKWTWYASRTQCSKDQQDQLLISQPKYDGTRTGQIIDYKEYCTGKTIKVYENELIKKQASDGKTYLMTTGDWGCYARKSNPPSERAVRAATFFFNYISEENRNKIKKIAADSNSEVIMSLAQYIDKNSTELVMIESFQQQLADRRQTAQTQLLLDSLYNANNYRPPSYYHEPITPYFIQQNPPPSYYNCTATSYSFSNTTSINCMGY